jgi:hypothetical protein
MLQKDGSGNAPDINLSSTIGQRAQFQVKRGMQQRIAARRMQLLPLRIIKSPQESWLENVNATRIMMRWQAGQIRLV